MLHLLADIVRFVFDTFHLVTCWPGQGCQSQRKGWAGVLIVLLGAVTGALHCCAEPKLPQYLPP